MKEARKACPSQPWRNGAQPGQHFPELWEWVSVVLSHPICGDLSWHS
jgi:hypothetical protein